MEPSFSWFQSAKHLFSGQDKTDRVSSISQSVLLSNNNQNLTVKSPTKQLMQTIGQMNPENSSKVKNIINTDRMDESKDVDDRCDLTENLSDQSEVFFPANGNTSPLGKNPVNTKENDNNQKIGPIKNSINNAVTASSNKNTNSNKNNNSSKKKSKKKSTANKNSRKNNFIKNDNNDKPTTKIGSPYESDSNKESSTENNNDDDSSQKILSNNIHLKNDVTDITVEDDQIEPLKEGFKRLEVEILPNFGTNDFKTADDIIIDKTDDRYDANTAVDGSSNINDEEIRQNLDHINELEKENARLQSELEKENAKLQIEYESMKDLKGKLELTVKENQKLEIIAKEKEKLELIAKEKEKLELVVKEKEIIIQKNKDDSEKQFAIHNKSYTEKIKQLEMQLKSNDQEKERAKIQLKNVSNLNRNLKRLTRSELMVKNDNIISDVTNKINDKLKQLRERIAMAEKSNIDKICFIEQNIKEKLGEIEGKSIRIITEKENELMDAKSKMLKLENNNVKLLSELSDLREEYSEFQKQISEVTLFGESLGDIIVKNFEGNENIRELDETFQKHRPDIKGFSKCSTTMEIEKISKIVTQNYKQFKYETASKLENIDRKTVAEFGELKKKFDEFGSVIDYERIESKINPIFHEFNNLNESINSNKVLLEQNNIDTNNHNTKQQNYILNAIDQMNQGNKESKIRLKAQESEITELKFENREYLNKIDQLINENKLQIEGREKISKEYNHKIYGLKNRKPNKDLNLVKEIFFQANQDLLKIDEIEALSLVELQEMINVILCSLMIPLDKIYGRILTLAIIIKWERNLVHFFINRINYQVYNEEIDFGKLNHEALTQLHHLKNMDKVRHPLQSVLEDLYENVVNRL